MKLWKTPAEKTELDEAIKEVLKEMKVLTADSTEYARMVKQLSKLYKLKEIDRPSRRVSPDTLAIIAGNLAGILVIVGFERTHLLTSKALDSVKALRPNR